jgi:transcriptional regulator with XRE-family HTH domain
MKGENMLKGTLRSLRRYRDITQTEAAETLGISVDALSNYERGKFYPTAPIIDRMLKLYDVKFEDINFLYKNND